MCSSATARSWAIGLGVGYLTPVKNLMLWFSDNKGLATGIAVAGFGLAKAIASPLMEYLIGTVGLVEHVLHSRRDLCGDDVLRFPAHQASGSTGSTIP